MRVTTYDKNGPLGGGKIYAMARSVNPIVQCGRSG